MARNLQVDADLSTDVQFVKDPSGAQSPLALSTNRVVVSNPGDGKVLLVLGSERSWVFKQRGSGSGTALELTASNPNNNNKNFVLNTEGRVGIGTTSPDSRLTVRDTIPAGTVTDKAALLSTLTSQLPGQGLAGQTAAIRGVNDEGHGVQGRSRSHIGVEGSSVDGTAIFAESQNGVAVWGEAPAGPFAGLFIGDVRVVGNLSKSGGGFTIDHPLSPAEMYLNHSFVESPERKNVYDGLVQLDGDGGAIVELPTWFEALNQHFRYQLTSIGAPAPNLHVAELIRDSRFRIAGGAPGQSVCWQVTGVRADAWAKGNRLEVEPEKADRDRGHYLHPMFHGAEDKDRITGYKPE